MWVYQPVHHGSTHFIMCILKTKLYIGTAQWYLGNFTGKREWWHLLQNQGSALSLHWLTTQAESTHSANFALLPHGPLRDWVCWRQAEMPPAIILKNYCQPNKSILLHNTNCEQETPNSWAQWFIPTILAMWEAALRRITVWGYPGQIVCKTLSPKPEQNGVQVWLKRLKPWVQSPVPSKKKKKNKQTGNLK
jgi:hypothetical protein